MELQSHIPLQSSKKGIDLNSNVLLIGSCFSDSIGAKLRYYQFKAEVNPFGVIFNPISIQKLIARVVQQDYFSETDFFEDGGLWKSYELHSEFVKSSNESALLEANTKLNEVSVDLTKATHIIITLGTAWVYELIASSEVVSNCHKQDSKLFDKRLLSVDEIQIPLKEIIRLVRSINPEITFVFTISPVRHTKDGFVENQRSKSHLITALHHVLDKDQSLDYFPSYEILMDELRDYRFYDRDLIHPNALAVDYIWEKFMEVSVDQNTKNDLKRIGKIQSGLSHNAFQPNSEAHQKFLKTIAEQIAALEEKYPNRKWNFKSMA